MASSHGEEVLEERAGALSQSCPKPISVFCFPLKSSLCLVCLPTQPTLPCFHNLKKGLTSSSEKLVIWGQGHTQGCPLNPGLGKILLRAYGPLPKSLVLSDS